MCTLHIVQCWDWDGKKVIHQSDKEREAARVFIIAPLARSHTFKALWHRKKRNKENGNSQTAIKKMNGMRTWYMAGLYTFVNVMSYVALLWNFHFISWLFLLFFPRRIYFYSCHMVTNLLFLIRNSSPLSGEVPLDIRYGFFYISIVPFKHASTQTFIHKKSYDTVEGHWGRKLNLRNLKPPKNLIQIVSLRERSQTMYRQFKSNTRTWFQGSISVSCTAYVCK